MALFRRGRKADNEPEEALEDQAGTDVEAASESDGVAGEAGSASPLPFDRSSGPWDISEIDLADPELPRLDLGSLQIPGIAGVNLQVEADQETQSVMAITAMLADGAVQVQAFAAPRSSGLWDEIRAEITSELAGGPGQFSEDIGAFGPEIRALLPAQAPDGRQGVQPVRFIGVDGPRWFLRGVFLGKAAVEPDPTDELHHLVREIIVVRGPDAMAPKTPLPLRLPPPQQPPATAGGEVGEDIEVAEESDDRYADINPFERGPEITEIR